MNKPPADNPFDAYNQANGGLRKFSDELIENFVGKLVEIYIGDQCETLTFEDYSVPQNCIIYGKLIEVMDRFLVLDCYYVDKKTNEVKSGNICYLNSFQVRAMTALNGNGTLNDIFLNAKSSEKVRKTLLAHQK